MNPQPWRAAPRGDGAEQPGWRWGPFTARVPLIHTRPAWPEYIQGVLVAGATGLAVAPLLESYFGLTYAESLAFIILQSMLIYSAVLLFGEPFAPGWITPALPLAMNLMASGAYVTPAERAQAMTAAALTFAALVLLLGASGLGRKFVEILPRALRAGIILGAGVAALKRVFIDDAPRFLFAQPVSMCVALGISLVLIFSAPLARWKRRWPMLARIASLGLLPGFVAAAAIGPLAGEIQYDIQGGLLAPPFGAMWAKASPFAIGWPTPRMFLDAAPLAFMSYIILFGDWVTGIGLLEEAAPDRPDEKVGLDPRRTHYSLAIRNSLMAAACPFFPTQGVLWAGVHVIIVQRWREGRQSLDSLFDGLSSYYVFGLPWFFFVLPLVTALQPLLGVALTLTLALTGFACAHVAMSIPRAKEEYGVALLTAVALAALPNFWAGLLIGAVASVALTDCRPQAAK